LNSGRNSDDDLPWNISWVIIQAFQGVHKIRGTSRHHLPPRWDMPPPPADRIPGRNRPRPVCLCNK
jgi:hypothetical protein